MSRTLSPPPATPVVVAGWEASLGATGVGLATVVASRLAGRLYGVEVSLPGTTAGPGPDPEAAPAGVVHLDGVPAIEIVRFAESRRAELIVLSPSGCGPGATERCKELSDAVVRRSEIPCLVLPEGQDRLGRMIVALDGSERGMRALRVAWQLRGLSDGQLSAIFVEPTLPTAEGVLAPRGIVAQTIGARAAAALEGAPAIAVTVRQGEVVTRMLEGLAAEAGDILVVGVRRGGPVEVSGSTGNGRRILAAAPCAVLTVPL